MAKNIIITNGVGEEEIINGSFDVAAVVTGYDNSTISPASISVVEGTNTYNFTISATGVLTLHVTEDGTSSGTPIVGATFVRVDSEGNPYSSIITTDSNGDAVFEHVPFAESGAPVVYFRQTASDGEHEFDNSIQNVTLTTSSEVIQIENAVGALRTITLTDANYNNLPISGKLILTNK